MKFLFGAFVCSLYFLFVETLHFNNVNREIVKFVSDVQKQYQATSPSNNVIVVLSGKYMEVSHEAEISVKLWKCFSDKIVSSTLTTVKSLFKIIKYHEIEHGPPLYVIVLESHNDFDHFANVSKSFRSLTLLLVFKSDDKSLMEICKNPKQNYFNLVFDSRMLVVCFGEDVPIREWYSINFDETETFDFATWTFKRGMQLLHSEFMYERRNSLKGMDLRVTYVKNEIAEKNGNLTGYFGELVRIIAKLANFTIKLQKPKHSYGLYDNVTKKWNGVIGMLANNKTDVGLGEFTMTIKRLPVVDFSHPIITSSTCFYIQKLDQNLPQSMYYNAFGIEAACLLVLIYLVAPILITCICYKHDKALHHKKDKWKIVRILMENYIEIWGIFCKMPLPRKVGISSLRIAYLSLLTFSLVLSSMYSAILTSYLSNLKFVSPFDSIHDFMNDGTFKMMTLQNTSLLQSVQDSNDPAINKLRPFFLDEKYLPRSLRECMKQLCDDKNIALYLDDYGIRQKRAGSTCDIVAFDKGHLASVSIAFVKHSPYMGLFDFWIQKLRSNGILNGLKKRDLQLNRPERYNYQQITFGNAKLIFMILIGGLCLSVMMLIFEKIFYYFSPTPQHEFAVSRTNYWTPLIRPPIENKK